MSTDQPPTTDIPHGAEFEPRGVTIGQAADRLGISENAIRQRIKRGTIDAAKVDGVWRIHLSQEIKKSRDFLTDQPGDHEGDYQATDQGDYQTDHEATSRQPVSVSPAALAQLDAIRDQWLQPLVDQIRELERDVGRLTAERDALRDTIAQQERPTTSSPIGEEVDAGPKVTPATLSPIGDSGDSAPAPRPWWRFWER